MLPVFKNVGERYTAKKYRPFSCLSMFSKVFEKSVNNRFVDHLFSTLILDDLFF